MDPANTSKITSFIWGIADNVPRDLKSRGSQQQLLTDFGNYLNGFSANYDFAELLDKAEEPR